MSLSRTANNKTSRCGKCLPKWSLPWLEGKSGKLILNHNLRTMDLTFTDPWLATAWSLLFKTEKHRVLKPLNTQKKCNIQFSHTQEVHSTISVLASPWDNHRRTILLPLWISVPNEKHVTAFLCLLHVFFLVQMCLAVYFSMHSFWAHPQTSGLNTFFSRTPRLENVYVC